MTGSRFVRQNRAMRRGCWWSDRATACRTRRFRELPSLLDPGDMLVFNDTKVIPAQLAASAARRRRAQIETTLHMRIGAGSLAGLHATGQARRAGDRIHFGHDGNSCFLGQLDATVIEKGEGGEVLLGFDLSGPFLDEALQPSAISRCRPISRRSATTTSATAADYQTIYAREEGAVAAPDGRPAFHAGAVAALDAKGVERRS